MRKMLLTVALVVSASPAHASGPMRLAQASGGLDATPPKQTEQRSLTLEPADPMNLKMAPVESPKSVESKPAESKSADIKPADDAPAAAKKKPVAKKRETDEEKARRIARRYGVTW